MGRTQLDPSTVVQLTVTAQADGLRLPNRARARSDNYQKAIYMDVTAAEATMVLLIKTFRVMNRICIGGSSNNCYYPTS